MKKSFAIFLCSLFLISNIHTINIKKNENSLAMKKSILNDLLNHRTQITKQNFEDRTQINVIMYKNQKNPVEIPTPTKEELVEKIKNYLLQQQLPQQVQQAVEDAVEQLQDLAQQQEVTPQQVQQALEQLLEQLPQDVAQQVQEAVQQLPPQVTPQQVQQVIDQVQQAQQQVAQQPQQQVPELNCQNIGPLQDFINDLFTQVKELLNTLTSNKSLLQSFKKSTNNEDAQDAASNLLKTYVNSFNKMLADLATVEEVTEKADEKCKSQIQDSLSQTQNALLQVKNELIKLFPS